jgi:hypothetical protein
VITIRNQPQPGRRVAPTAITHFSMALRDLLMDVCMGGLGG